MHTVSSPCTFLSVNQLCLIKPFPFHAHDQTSWRLEVKCWWYIYCMCLSETCQKIDILILYWPWCMFSICKWKLSELTARNSNVASSLFLILALVLFFFYCLWLLVLDLLSVWPMWPQASSLFPIDVILFVPCFHLHNLSVFYGSSDCYFHIGEALCSSIIGLWFGHPFPASTTAPVLCICDVMTKESYKCWVPMESASWFPT